MSRTFGSDYAFATCILLGSNRRNAQSCCTGSAVSQSSGISSAPLFQATPSASPMPSTPTATATSTPFATTTATPGPVLEFEGVLTTEVEGCWGLKTDDGQGAWPLAGNILGLVEGERVRITGYYEPFTGVDVCQAGRYFIVLTVIAVPVASATSSPVAIEHPQEVGRRTSLRHAGRIALTPQVRWRHHRPSIFSG